MSTKPPVRELVKMLVAMGERKDDLTEKQLAELRQAAEWLLPKPTKPSSSPFPISFLRTEMGTSID